MGKKKLDNLFQERLKNFSEMPSESVWQSIETSLNQKKKSRKLIPIWWKLGGVAAVLAIAIFFMNPFKENVVVENPAVTDSDTSIEKTTEENQFEQPSSKELENSILEKSKVAASEDENNLLLKEPNLSVNLVTKSSNLKNNSKADATEQNVIQKLNAQDAQIVNNESNGSLNANDITESTTITKKTDLKLDQETTSILNNASKQEVIAQTNETRNLNLATESIVNEEGEKITKSEQQANKKSIFDEIAKQDVEDEVLAENSANRWSAGPSIAPVYFNAIGEGSPVHSIFVPNSKSGDVTLSYGLSVAYEVSKKLSIRSGVHKVDFGYNTNDVEFSSSVEAARNRQIDNVDYALTAKNLVVSSKSANQVDNSNINAVPNEVLATSASRDGVMEQQFGYIEVPVELNYALIDKRFGVNLIGGVSSLFLIDNSVSLTSGDLITEIGEANNMNSVNFSTNVGFGINYKFTSKVKLNVEPVFKYQLNTFSATDGSFQPFSVGIYSGLSFRF